MHIGGLASMTAELVTIPMDVSILVTLYVTLLLWILLFDKIFNQTCKVRLQLNAEGGGEKAYKGIVDCIVKIVRTEGIGGLYKGLSPALLRQAVYSSSRMAGILNTFKYIINSDITIIVPDTFYKYCII